MSIYLIVAPLIIIFYGSLKGASDVYMISTYSFFFFGSLALHFVKINKNNFFVRVFKKLSQLALIVIPLLNLAFYSLSNLFDLRDPSAQEVVVDKMTYLFFLLPILGFGLVYLDTKKR